VGVPGVGVPRSAGVLWGMTPTGGRRSAAARARRSRATCTARSRAGRTELGERELTGGHDTVPGGGATDRWGRPVSGRGGERGARGPAREESGVAEPR
jgi:hypothetical protein